MMSTLPVTALRSKYRELASLFITEVNQGALVLYLPSQTSLTPNSGNFTEEPSNLSAYGGRQPANIFPDRQEEAFTNRHEEPLTEVIAGRTYWTNAQYDRNGNVISEKSQLKFITYLTNASKLENGLFAVVDGIKVKIKEPPIPYGLFGKFFCISYWEAYNG